MIEGEGFVDRASASGAGRIRWDEVEESGTFGYGGERYLGVVAGRGVGGPKHRNPLARPINLITRKLLRWRAPTR